MPGLRVQGPRPSVQVAGRTVRAPSEMAFRNGVVRGRTDERAINVRNVRVLVGVFIALGALAWGIGWMAYGLFDRQTSLPPTVPSKRTEGLPTASPNPSPNVTFTSSSDSVAFTPSPDSVAFTPGATGVPTPLPATSTSAPTAETQVQTLIVGAGDRGVYDVIRRACGLPRDYILSPNDEITQETWLLNEFAEENPLVEEGQAIQVPIHLCP